MLGRGVNHFWSHINPNITSVNSWSLRLVLSGFCLRLGITARLDKVWSRSLCLTFFLFWLCCFTWPLNLIKVICLGVSHCCLSWNLVMRVCLLWSCLTWLLNGVYSRCLWFWVSCLNLHRLCFCWLVCCVDYVSLRCLILCGILLDIRFR